jgi:hypothetical protein
VKATRLSLPRFLALVLVFSGGVVNGATYAGGLAPIAAYLVIGLVLVARRHRIEPVSGRTPAPSA